MLLKDSEAILKSSEIRRKQVSRSRLSNLEQINIQSKNCLFQNQTTQ